MFKINSTAEGLIGRIQARTALMNPNSPQMTEAMTRIGMRIKALAILNLRRQRMVDSGQLINSIQYKFKRDGDHVTLLAGSFGAPHASINEFGGLVTAGMYRALFWKLKEQGKLDNYEPKGVIKNGWWKERPYLRPAWQMEQPYIATTLARAMGFKV